MQKYKKYSFLFLTLLILVAIPFTQSLTQKIQDLRQKASETATSLDAQKVQQLTTQLLERAKSADTGGAKTQASDDLQRIATERKDIMLNLAQKDPKAFLQNAMTASNRDTLPEKIKTLVEERRTITGEVRVTKFDDFKNKKSKLEYHLDPKMIPDIQKDELTLEVVHPQHGLLSGQILKVQGVSLEKILVSEGMLNVDIHILGGGYDIPSDVLGQYGDLNPLGEQKIAVIFFNFVNDTSTPISKEKVANLINGTGQTLKDYYAENSYGKTSVSADVFGYYTIPLIKESCSSSDWVIAADSAAFQNGVPIQNYTRRMYFFPRDYNCFPQFGAWADVGGKITRSWMGEADVAGVMAHEFGHNLGLNHSNAYDCGDTQVSRSETNDCRSYEYGDWYDVMGSTGNFNQFNAPHKASLGWLTQDQQQRITTSGTYTVTALENPTNEVKLLEIPIPNSSRYYYVSFRKAIGFDQNLPKAITQGFSLHTAEKDKTYTQLIDSTPEPDFVAYGFEDAAFSDSIPFNDSYNGITIKQLSHTSESATVQVSFDQSICRHVIPTLLLTPDKQEGGTSQQVPYHLTVKNNDNSLCESTEFKLHADYIDGWDFKLIPGKILLNPGETKEAQVLVTASPDAKNGIQPFTVLVSSTQPRHFATVSGLHSVNGQGNLWRLEVQPGYLDTLSGKAPIGLSALAFGRDKNPLWSGVTYEWGISSDNSIGILTETNQNVTSFKPLKEGFGNIYVIARYNGEVLTKGISVNVYEPSPTPTMTKPSPIALLGDINHDNKVDIQDYNIFVTDFEKSGSGIRSDLNNSGKVDIQDYNIFVTNFGKSI